MHRKFTYQPHVKLLYKKQAKTKFYPILVVREDFFLP